MSVHVFILRTTFYLFWVFFIYIFLLYFGQVLELCGRLLCFAALRSLFALFFYGNFSELKHVLSLCRSECNGQITQMRIQCSFLLLFSTLLLLYHHPLGFYAPVYLRCNVLVPVVVVVAFEIQFCAAAASRRR